MTTVLAFDTATDVVTVAVGRHGAVVAARVVDSDRAHAERLVPTVRDVVAEAGLTLADLDALAVGVGPGRFTGLRVGVTTAKAFGLALAVPVVGLDTLGVVAHPWRDDERDVVAVIDARRREVFWARYRPRAGALEPVVAPGVATPADLVAALGTDAVVCVGDGVDRYRRELAAAPGAECLPPQYSAPSPLALCELADAALTAGAGGPPEVLAPVYLRDSDAVINWGSARPGAAP